MVIVREYRRLPLPVRGLEHRFEAVGDRLVGAEDPEVALLVVEPHKSRRNRAEHARIADAEDPGHGHRRRNRESPACASRAAACRRWRRDWLPCAARPRAPARASSGSSRPCRRRVPRAGSSGAIPRAVADASGDSWPNRSSAPDARGRCLRFARRRRLWAGPALGSRSTIIGQRGRARYSLRRAVCWISRICTTTRIERARPSCGAWRWVVTGDEMRLVAEPTQQLIRVPRAKCAPSTVGLAIL